MTLLVIDDDELDRKAVARAVRTLGAGYELKEARDGRQGLALAAADAAMYGAKKASRGEAAVSGREFL